MYSLSKYLTTLTFYNLFFLEFYLLVKYFSVHIYLYIFFFFLILVYCSPIQYFYLLALLSQTDPSWKAYFFLVEKPTFAKRLRALLHSYDDPRLEYVSVASSFRSKVRKYHCCCCCWLCSAAVVDGIYRYIFLFYLFIICLCWLPFLTLTQSRIERWSRIRDKLHPWPH